MQPSGAAAADETDEADGARGAVETGFEDGWKKWCNFSIFDYFRAVFGRRSWIFFKFWRRLFRLIFLWIPWLFLFFLSFVIFLVFCCFFFRAEFLANYLSIVLWNGLLRYILHTCPKLWCNPCSKCYAVDCFGTNFTHVQSCDVTRVPSATQWTASVHTSHMPKAVM